MVRESLDFRTFFRCVDWIYLATGCSFNVFRFRVSFFVWDCENTVRCWRTGVASCRAAAAKLFDRKNLESTLAGPCFRAPKSSENRLRSKIPPELKIPGCVKDSCAYSRRQF